MNKESLPGLSSYWKNLKKPFLGEYFKFLSLGNSNGSKANPKIFFENISKNTAARGIPSFGLIEGAAGLLIRQSPKFWCQISTLIWWCARWMLTRIFSVNQCYVKNHLKYLFKTFSISLSYKCANLTSKFWWLLIW